MIKDPVPAKIYHLFEPPVSFRMYWREGALLFLANAIPVGVWLYCGDSHWVARSGSLTVLFSAIAEFVFLHSVNRKHLLNACRVLDKEEPWDFSRASHWVGGLALATALIGTVLWGYGDSFARAAR
jgi:hypothetical protein